MVLILLLAMLGAVFPVQLYLCLRGRNHSIRILPLAITVMYTLCCATFACAPAATLSGEDGRLAALIAMAMGLFGLASDVLAWLLFAVMKYVQNTKK